MPRVYYTPVETKKRSLGARLTCMTATLALVAAAIAPIASAGSKRG